MSNVLPWFLRWKLPPERPLYLIVGRRGSGKTLLATEMALGRMRRGERVYANYDIANERYGVRAGRVFSLLDCMNLRNCTIVIDEANNWVSAREWTKIPSQVIAGWQMSRKDGVDFIFTSQHESRVDLIVRQLADWVLLCERVPLVPRWVPFFRVHWTWLEDVDMVRRGKLSRPEYRWVRQRVFESYGTDDRIDPEQLEKLSAYTAAVKAGSDPDPLAYGLPERIEPSRRNSAGVWVPWDSLEVSEVTTRAEEQPST